MKRTALTRKTPLRRKKPMKRWRPKAERRNSYARRERDVTRMLWIKTQPCRLAHEPDASCCDGGVEADHIGEIGVRAMGRKAPDDTCIPFCTKHHAERTGRNGFFEGWDVLTLRAWAEEQIAHYQQLYASHVVEAA